MQNLNNEASNPKQQTQIDEVIDVFKNLVANNSGAILASSWPSTPENGENQSNDSRRNQGNNRNQSPVDTKGTTDGYKNKGGEENSRTHWGDTGSSTSNQDGNAWNKKKEEASWNNSWNDTDYSTNNTRYQNPAINSYTVNGGGYPDLNNGIVAEGSNNKTDTYANINSHQNSWDNNQGYNDQFGGCPSTSESHTETDQNSEEDTIKLKLSAWHNLGANSKDREDGLGGGQLHRQGRNFIPVDEATVLAIQQKGKSYKKPRSRSEKFTTPKPKNLPTKQEEKPHIMQPQKSSAQSFLPNNPYIPKTNVSQKPPVTQKTPETMVPAKAPVLQNQRQNTQSTPNNQLQQKTSQTPPSSKPQRSWELVNTPFWEIPTKSSPPHTPHTVQNPSSSRNPSTNEVVTNQYQPVRSPVQEFELPYIPPEFDSTPYRNKSSHLPTNGNNESVRDDRENTIDEGNYEPDNDFEHHQNDYEEESDVCTVDEFDRYQESKNKKVISSMSRFIDRGHLLLTINVELSEDTTQAIEVHVNDDPSDLASEFCDLWKVTNPVVEPALVCLIKEEKEKRLCC
ncbi:2389_t:CDS:2 [Funneliformis caledonium]|uniref:2389_t:CDS:1 n=1 Tax=Funneliformis caledonium TaxID=1117310 RepID=A0A9N8UZ15_9GLOM|nr:2389_t:CDS:2 [Funneliformis caledonium]